MEYFDILRPFLPSFVRCWVCHGFYIFQTISKLDRICLHCLAFEGSNKLRHGWKGCKMQLIFQLFPYFWYYGVKLRNFALLDQQIQTWCVMSGLAYQRFWSSQHSWRHVKCLKWGQMGTWDEIRNGSCLVLEGQTQFLWSFGECCLWHSFWLFC